MLLMEKLPLSELLFPVAQAGFAAKARTWAVQSFIKSGSCVPSSRLGSVPPVVPRFDQWNRCSGETPSTATWDRSRSCVEDLKFSVEHRTCNILALLGISTLDDL